MGNINVGHYCSLGGILWWEWLFLILAVVIDIGAYTGGGYGNKDRIPGMS